MEEARRLLQALKRASLKTGITSSQTTTVNYFKLSPNIGTQIYMYVYMYVCIYVYIYEYICLYVSIHISLIYLTLTLCKFQKITQDFGIEIEEEILKLREQVKNTEQKTTNVLVAFCSLFSS